MGVTRVRGWGWPQSPAGRRADVLRVGLHALGGRLGAAVGRGVGLVAGLAVDALLGGGLVVVRGLTHDRAAQLGVGAAVLRRGDALVSRLRPLALVLVVSGHSAPPPSVARVYRAAPVTATRHTFEFEGHTLVYDEYGAGERAVVLMPGLLFSRTMHGPLATTLAERGYRVLCLDLLGHGDSDRPPEMWNYTMTLFGAQTLALLDHLEIDKAVLGGTSLGANTTLEACAADQSRVQGMLIEMPVLDNALLGCAIGFTPLLMSLTFGAPVRARVGTAGLAGAAPRPAAGPDAAGLGQPGPQAVGVGGAGPVLRPRGAAHRRAADVRAAAR